MKHRKDIVYKETIINLLLKVLEIAGTETAHSKNFEDDYRKRLKFQKQTDWKRYRASVDLIVDTEYAISSAFQYQLGDLNNKNNDIGEQNLRLYGILNAVYLQMGAFEEIAILLHFSDRKRIRSLFYNLDIYRLRGIAGAHTVDYLYDKQILQSKPEINKTTSFRIVQYLLEKTGKEITALDENDITFKFNLIKILTEYEKIAMDLLIQLIHHSVKTLVNNKEQKKTIKKWLEHLLSDLIDYSQIDKNKEYTIKERKKTEKMIFNLEKSKN